MRSLFFIAVGLAALLAGPTFAIRMADATGDPTMMDKANARREYQTCFMKKTLVLTSGTPRLESVRRCKLD